MPDPQGYPVLELTNLQNTVIYQVWSNGTVVYNTGVTVNSGNGSPNSVVTAPPGSLYIQADGVAPNQLWQKQTGTGNSGWVALAPGGGGGTTTNPLTINNSGSGAASGSTFNGAAPITISYNSIGAAPLASPTFTGTVTTAASATTGAGLNLPHGAAPTTPNNGDLWTTTTGLFARINGVTVGPYGTATISGMTSGQVAIANGASSIGSSVPLAGAGAGIVTGPTSATAGHLLQFSGTAGQVSDSGIAVANVSLLSGTTAFTAKQTFQASVTGGASITLPHGVAPTAPVNGDVWTTSAGGMFVRINGVTQNLAPLASPTFTGTVTLPATITQANTTTFQPTSGTLETWQIPTGNQLLLLFPDAVNGNSSATFGAGAIQLNASGTGGLILKTSSPAGKVQLDGVSAYNHTTATQGEGLVAIPGADAVSAQAANYNGGTAKTITNAVGSVNLYHIIGVLQITQAATTSSVTPSLTVNYNDVTGTARTLVIQATSAANALGTILQFDAKFMTNNTPSSLTAAGYSSTGATPMQYALSFACMSLVQI